MKGFFICFFDDSDEKAAKADKPEDPELLTPQQLADLSGEKLWRIHELTRKGLIPGLVDLGPRKKKYNKAMVLKWINEGGLRKSHLRVVGE